MQDQVLMRRAYAIAAQSKEDVACGCVIVLDGRIVAEECNSQNIDQIAVHHAEVKATYQANRKTGTRKLEGAIAYCTCEPCAMCLAALSYAKVKRIVFDKTMADLFPDDPQSHFDSKRFLQTLNYVPKIEQLLYNRQS